MKKTVFVLVLLILFAGFVFAASRPGFNYSKNGKTYELYIGEKVPKNFNKTGVSTSGTPVYTYAISKLNGDPYEELAVIADDKGKIGYIRAQFEVLPPGTTLLKNALKGFGPKNKVMEMMGCYLYDNGKCIATVEGVKNMYSYSEQMGLAYLTIVTKKKNK